MGENSARQLHSTSLITVYRMRIVLFFSFEISLEEWRDIGILDREVRLYQELIRRYGVTVKFVTYGGKEDRGCLSKLRGIQVLPAYQDRPPPRGRLSRLFKSFSLPWTMARELSTVDLYKSNQMMGAWVGVVSKLRFRKPLLVRCGFELSENNRLGRAKWWHQVGGWGLSFVSYQLADRIHVATLTDKKLIEERFRVPKHKIHVRPNWVDSESFSPSSDESKKAKRVLFVGRFSEEKNLPLLINAISGTDMTITIVGSGGDEKIIQEKIDREGIEAEINNRVPNHRMPALYQQCSVYVICSRYEGNPKSLLEAMACGCAVIGTNVRGIREIIEHGKTGILVEQDAFALRQAMLDLINNQNLCLKLGKAARECVLRNHSLDAAVEAEWQAYTALAKLGSKKG